MHLVEVRGGRKGQRELVEMIVYPLIKHLMPRLRNIEIDIKLVKNLYKKTGAEGFCLQDEPRRYELEIDTALGFRDFITTICHEMVHVKQDYRKDKRPIEDREKEAYEQQEILFERWKNDN